MKKKFNQIISDCFGKGLIASVIFKKYNKFSAREIADKVSFKCLKKGLLVCNTGRESIKLGPPLIIDKKGMIEGFKKFYNSVREVSDEIS